MEGDFEANARRRYKEHYNMVLELAPQGHLLDYQISEGWGPLCHFLGKDKPDLPFPQVNSSDVIMSHRVLGQWYQNIGMKIVSRWCDRCESCRFALVVYLRISHRHGDANTRDA